MAHNNLFVQADLDSTIKLHDELKIIIGNAEEKINEFKFSIEEQVAIREAITESNKEEIVNIEGIKITGKIDLSPFEKENEPIFDIINEETFFEELNRAERTLKKQQPNICRVKSFCNKNIRTKRICIWPKLCLS